MKVKSIKFLYKYIKKDLLKIIGVILAVISFVFLTLLTPLMMGFIIDNVINLEPITNPIIAFISSTFGGVRYLRDNLWVCCLLIVFIEIFAGIGRYLRGRWNAFNSENVARRLRNDLYSHLQILPYAYHVSSKTGDLIQRCTSDVDQIRRFVANQISEVVYCISTAGIAAIILFSVYPSLAMIAVISMPILVVFSYFFFTKMQATFRKSDEAEGVMTSVVQENVSGVRVVKAFNQEIYEMNKFEKKNREFTDLTFELIRLLGFYWSFSDLICLLQILAVVLFGVYFTINGNLSLGNYFVFITYEGMILWPVRQLGRIIADMGKMSVSISRLEEILDEMPEDMLSGDEVEVEGNIVFQDVHFEYDEYTKVLKGVSFDVKKGETIAIMGPTGSGKSSLIHLLTRLYEYSGSIKIDGKELREISKACIRKQVGLVLQEPFLFSKTIKENIMIASQNASENELYRAAKVASVHEVIKEFDKGYETTVGEQGVTLSGGQKQRIAIARTIINNCPIMIFDDSLSAVDTDTDALIRDELGKLESKPTMFIITHRVTSAMKADKIVVLEDGVISQMGTHDKLMQEEGLYARVASIQQMISKGDEIYE